MGLSTNKRRREIYLKRLDKMLLAFGAHHPHGIIRPYEYIMYSRGGEWSITICQKTGDFFSRFEQPELLRNVLTGVNIHSGKFNIHFGGNTDVNEAIYAIIRKVLHVAPVEGYD